MPELRGQLNGIDLSDLTTNEILEHLPSLEDAPVLEHLAHLGMKRFFEEYTLPAPVDDEGLVDHVKLVDSVKSFVSPDYRWAAPFFDVDHIYWSEAKFNRSTNEDGFLEGLRYDDTEREVISVRREFRDVDRHKIGVARQFHNLKELVIREPDIPDMDIMRREIRAHRRRQYLYQYATGAVTIHEKLQRARPMMLNKKIELIDMKDRRVYYNPTSMEERRANFIRRLLHHHKIGRIDLTQLAPLEVVDSETVEEALPEIADMIINEGMVTIHSQRVRRVELLTYRPGERKTA